MYFRVFSVVELGNEENKLNTNPEFHSAPSCTFLGQSPTFQRRDQNRSDLPRGSSWLWRLQPFCNNNEIGKHSKNT